MQVFANTVLPREMAAAQSGSSGDSSTNSATTSSANITANDFLELLVSEMKNQDPTSQTDPNEYINQLVQVNSLEQLVQINSDLSGSSGSAGTGSSGGTGSGTDGSTAAVVSGAAGQSNAVAAAAKAPAAAVSSGNLSAANPGNAASHVASALATAAQTLAPGANANPYDSILAAIKSRAHAGQHSTSNPVR
ncbi:MAG TPA: flagellar hook capping FlgD N-terminal domain-containing protein [Acidobacteriaceae bacterium]|jgi:flagellar basal-body rod modification protein FlgD|nr:flagellar hook capping FlgD N-terminal domain-containing protein [Acidobacteriaceae bacterium]